MPGETGLDAEPLDALQALFDGMTVIDLTHRLEPNIPAWPTHARYCHNLVESYEFGDASCHHQLVMSEHSGTHFDAPLHFIAGRASIADIPPRRFIGRMATIGATDVGPCGLVGVDRIREWEARFGPIQENDAVFFHFGWDRFWATRPAGDDFLKNWPGLSREACEYLVERGIRVTGCDCLSIDSFTASGFPAHHTLLSAGIAIGENFNNLGRLPPFCFGVMAPLPIANGSGAPVRALAFLPREQG